MIDLFGRDSTIYFAVLESVKRVAIGYIIAMIMGFGLGFVFTRLTIVRDQLCALFMGLQSLPNVCWLPFAILWFGLNQKAVIFVVVIGALLAITISTESAISNVSPLFIKSARTMGASRFQTYYKVIIPAAMPEILTGLKNGWSFAWRGLIASEMFVSAIGLGQMLMMGREMADINRVVALMIVIIGLGLFLDRFLFGYMENRIRTTWGLNQLRSE